MRVRRAGSLSTIATLATLGLATLALGCAAADAPAPGGGSAEVPGGADLEPAPPACRAIATPGKVVLARSISGGETLAIDGNGDLFYTADRGIVKETAGGEPGYAYPFGSALAVDRAGDAFVADTFDGPIDLGRGILRPTSARDVFVAKLSPLGEVELAEDLGPAGTDEVAIAAAPDGRIAVAGLAGGTVLLERDGSVVGKLGYGGQLAFGAQGELYVAGAFTGSLRLDDAHVLAAAGPSDTDAFLVALDRDGHVLHAVRIGDTTATVHVLGEDVKPPREQRIAKLAVDAAGEVAVFGTFSGEVDLFGQTLVMPTTVFARGFLGTFVAKLDADLDVEYGLLFGDHYASTPEGSIALDSAGNLLVSSSWPKEDVEPYATPGLAKLDAIDGSHHWGSGRMPDRGYGLGVTTDACGNAWWVETGHTNRVEGLHPVLRWLAR